MNREQLAARGREIEKQARGLDVYLTRTWETVTGAYLGVVLMLAGVTVLIFAPWPWGLLGLLLVAAGGFGLARWVQACIALERAQDALRDATDEFHATCNAATREVLQQARSNPARAPQAVRSPRTGRSQGPSPA